MMRPLSPAPVSWSPGPQKGSSPMDTSKLSFSERKAQKENMSPPTPADGARRIMRDITRPPPGDVTRSTSNKSQKGLGKRRSNVNFLEDAFAAGESSAAKERVRGDAIVFAEVKTNVIISDEFTFITELSCHLSIRYQRPMSSIVVSLHHGACMFFAGSFDAAYVMTISALPSQVLPTTNKRNAALVQKHMEEAIGVQPKRGLIRFVPIQEENMANNGKTMAGEIDELERNGCVIPTPEVSSAGESGTSDARRSKARRKLSVKSFTNFRPPSGIAVPAPELTPPASADETLPAIPGSPTINAQGKSDTEAPATLQKSLSKKAKRKKSFVATIFLRSGNKPEYSPGLAAIPSEET
ncbi:Tautomerase/MIF superfamily [Podospora aff. communis PSN243]|uniref:L-dopachrome isomerase n=1 Tax=Podospora aff. communis PSN243 TaxID=3040156 RepID=A0AAV9H4S3_9PEZI|nr:Tautomerase/MIF superfamily [Podospora aff. communis PSN243]